MPRLIATAVLATLMLLGSAGAALAAPVAEEDRVPIDLRRTTLIVSDIENSLKFYRDALGFQVIYDNMIRTPRSATSDEEAEISRRLVFVRANDDYIGIIGLLEYVKPRKPVREREPQPFSEGSAVLLFTTTGLKEKFAAATAVPGVQILDEPTDTEYPGYGGEGTIGVRVSTMYDPDGFLIELNEFID